MNRISALIKMTPESRKTADYEPENGLFLAWHRMYWCFDLEFSRSQDCEK